MITSAANPKVKNLIRLESSAKARRQQGLYVAEGVRMFREAPGDMIGEVYVSESFIAQPGNGELIEGKLWGKEISRGEPYEVLSDSVFGHVSDTKTPQGILFLMKMREYGSDDIPGASEDGLWVILESLQDPGNLGTVFRTAEGAGATGILMDVSTADIYNPKTVRSTMGSIFRVPFYITDDLAEAVGKMRSGGIRIFAADGNGNGLYYTEEDYTGPTAFMIGNEGNGLSEGTLKEADCSVRIPMRGQLESLNASVAAGILLYEADRQRRNAGKSRHAGGKK